MRIRIAGLSIALLLAGTLACGGGDGAGDEKDMPGVDASGTADTEIFTNDPDTTGVPVAGKGGTPVDSVRPGTPGTPAAGQSDVGKQP